MLDGDQIIGSFILFLENPADGAIWVGNIFINRDDQDLGAGTAAMEFIHEMYPAEICRLETPGWAIRNHHFYEKSGYRKVKES